MRVFSTLILVGLAQIFHTSLAMPQIPSLEHRQLGSCATEPCAIGLCCSKYDYCGTGSDYCQAGSCAGGVGGTCAAGYCCSRFGYCGTGSEFCTTTAIPAPTPTPTPSTAPAPTTTPTSPGTVNQWNQCGGQGWSGGTATGRAASSPSGPAPTIDIGYAVHQATINDTGYPYYNFSNIRFGASPTGELRFAAPISPNVVNRTVNDGQNGGTCPQANPEWLLIAEEFLSGAPIASLANQTAPSSLNISSLPKPGPQTSEDCLFLDVIVPESIYEAPCAIASRERFIAGDRDSESDNGAAVLVWIYGGGFTTGSKTDSGNPAGILARARDNNSTGVIFVAINYRLGLFGWLSGPSFLEDKSAIANAGLYDQRLALEWVKTHIHLFGGDPTRVTVIGESGGGASIEHQITAYGGKRNAPFHQAILQSPGFKPKPGKAEQEEIFQKTLHIASLIAGKNVTKSHQLRGLSFIELYYTNVVAVGTGVYGSFTYGPVLDGSFVPDLPGKLLLEGKFDHSLNIMTSYNSAEGLVFSSPFFQNNTDFVAYVQSVLPTASPSTIDYVTKILYPDLSNGSVGYGTQLNRTSLFNSEFSFTCNTWYLDVAFKNKTYAYFFSVPPGLHAIDIPYTFFNGDSTTADDGVPVNAKIAVALQRYITNFAMRGNPNQGDVPYFPVYGTNTSMQNIGFDGFGTQVRDEAANTRCDWWQRGLYY